MDVQFQEYRPVQALRPYVQRFWTGRFDGRRTGGLAQRVVPSGFVECIIHLTDHHCDLPDASGWRPSPDYTLIGLQNAPYEVRFSDAVEVFAIRFSPAGFFSLFGVPPGDFVDAHDDLAAVLGARFRDVASQIRDEGDVAGRLHVAERYLHGAADDHDATYLNHAEQLIRRSEGRLSVEAVTGQLPVSRRQLERAFKSRLGMTPKQYMRIARLNRAQRFLLDGQCRNLAEVAYAAGYADQPHFTHEFTSFVGRSPSRYLAQRSAYAVNSLWDGREAEAEPTDLLHPKGTGPPSPPYADRTGSR